MKKNIDLHELMAEVASSRGKIWDTLWENKSINRIAVKVCPNKETIKKSAEKYEAILNWDVSKPERWTQEWDQAIKSAALKMIANLELPGDWFPAFDVPRPFHGQSQGVCDLFGLKVEAQEDGNYYPHPLTPDPVVVDNVQTKPVNTSVYWGAIEWVRYAYAVTDGAISFRNPVMTGPIDTANYILGTTTLMEWLYTEPEVVHRLLDKITKVIIDFVQALKEAAGGTFHSDCGHCTRGGFSFCSEVRSIISQDSYEEFEAPYLRKIGEAVGTYSIHACGGWERTVASALQDPNLRMMHGQVRENNLAELFKRAAGKMTFGIGPSLNLDERYTWPNMESFYSYIINEYSPKDLLEVSLAEDNFASWQKLYKEKFADDGQLSPAILG